MAVEVTQRKTEALPSLRALFNDGAENTRARVLGIYCVLLVFNGAAWLSAILAFRHFPVLLGTAFLAYSFGLRHAVDADHIAAIDNVTRCNTAWIRSGKWEESSARSCPPSFCLGSLA
jgi:high-affinity nickel permease